MTQEQPALFDGGEAAVKAPNGRREHSRSRDDAAEAPRTLSARRQRAAVAATKRADGGPVGAVLRRLAEDQDGAADVDALLEEGFPANAIGAAEDKPGDARTSARAEFIDGDTIRLTAAGWTFVGQPGRKPTALSAESREHATAPRRLRQWLDAATAPYGVHVEVSTGTPCAEFRNRVEALAWARLKTVSDAGGTLGDLTRGLVPDALLVERWATPELYRGAWGELPDDPDDLAEQVLGLETEYAGKSDPLLRYKVQKWNAALELRACHAVIWVVRSRALADRLAALGVGRGRQLLVPASAVGLGGEEMPEYANAPEAWWPLRLRTGGPR